MKFLEETMVMFDVAAQSPEEAIDLAGRLLVKSGAVEQTYVEAMKSVYQTLGPYFVLAPQIALPHARPENGVKEASVSLVRLENPLYFGHECNDPVRLVFALGASNDDEHVTLLGKLVDILSDEQNLNVLMKASRYDEIKDIIFKSM